jgi:hypothetical protein
MKNTISVSKEELIDLCLRYELLGIDSVDVDNYRVSYTSNLLYLSRYLVTRKQNSIEIEDYIDALGKSSFARCKRLQGIVLNKHLRRIEKSSLMGCASLQFVNTEQCESLEYIGSFAFAYCPYLKYFSVTSPVSYIGDYAFISSPLESIEINSTAERLVIDRHAFANVVLKVNCKVLELYESILLNSIKPMNRLGETTSLRLFFNGHELNINKLDEVLEETGGYNRKTHTCLISDELINKYPEIVKV